MNFIGLLKQWYAHAQWDYVYSVALMLMLLILFVRHFWLTRNYRLYGRDKRNYHRWFSALEQIQDDKDLKITGKRARELFLMKLSPLQAFNQVRSDYNRAVKLRKRAEKRIEKNRKKERRS